MIVNSSLTVYHKEEGLDLVTHLERWTRHNYGTPDNPTVWFFGGKGAG